MAKIRVSPILSAASRAEAHLRTLAALHDSLFAPHFRALEHYGDPSPPMPSPADVVAAAKATLAWHVTKETELAGEIADRRAKDGNPILIDEAARNLAYHRGERERIARDLADLEVETHAAQVSAA